MRLVKGFVLSTCLAAATAIVASSPTTVAAAPNKAALKAMLEKCSREADKKGLDLKKDKSKAKERAAFRKDCMSKMGVEPKT